MMSFWSFQSSCQKDKAIVSLLLLFIIVTAAWWCARNSSGISWSWACGYTCVMLTLWKEWTWKCNSQVHSSEVCANKICKSHLQITRRCRSEKLRTPLLQNTRLKFRSWRAVPTSLCRETTSPLCSLFFSCPCLPGPLYCLVHIVVFPVHLLCRDHRAVCFTGKPLLFFVLVWLQVTSVSPLGLTMRPEP